MEKIGKSKKLNIVMLGHKRIPSREGGIEVVVEELSTRMVALGNNVTCYNRSGHHISGKQFDGNNLKKYKGISLKYVPTLNRKGLAAMTSSIIGAFWAAFGKYDVVHFHAEGPAFMCWLPKLCGKRVVVTVHGLDHKRAKWGKWASSYIMAGEKNAVRFADEIIVLSKGMQSYFIEKYDRKTKLIPNGVSRIVSDANGGLRINFGLEKSGYILFVGRIVPEKGIQYLIEAFNKLRSDKKLVIAGGSSDTGRFLDELREMAASNDRIIFTGFVQGDELKSLYSNAYLYVLFSDLEGMPLTLLEAMSFGNCCVVSDIAECVEVVGRYGVIVERGRVDKLTTVLQKLLDEPDVVESYKKNAAYYIEQKYSWDSVVNETLECYRAISKER